ncbi:MAG TPA: TIGR04255 family protein [Longimicrobium sp.]|nr:TIGR04255 family protein [Longimicrobium sp.]
MSEYEIFPNAPVEEAIITIGVSPIGELNEGVERLANAFATLYPVVETLETTGPAGEAEPGGPIRPGETTYRFLSADRQQAVQVTSTTFSFHRLRPYTHWQRFSADARIAWQIFVPTFQPKSIKVLRLRYLNSLSRSADERWTEYLTMHPSIPDPLTPTLVSSLVSLSFADGSVPAIARVNQTSEAMPDGEPRLVYDIDTQSFHKNLDVEGDRLWLTLDKLCEFKDRLFSAGLTERAKELFR